MRSILILPLAASFALAACSSGGADSDGDGEITSEEAAEEASEGGTIAMRPGEWEHTIQYTEMDLPGVPADMKDMVMQQMGSGVTTKSCMTEQDLGQPDADFFGGEAQENCTYQEFDRSGNRMTVRMTCDGGQGGKVNVNMDGEFSADSFSLTMDNKVTGSPQGDVTMKGKITGRRVGDCPSA